MITKQHAAGAAGDVVTECFRRHMSREAGMPTVLHAPRPHKFDGVGGFASGSTRIPVRAVVWSVVLIAGIVGFVRVATAAGFF